MKPYVEIIRPLTSFMACFAMVVTASLGAGTEARFFLFEIIMGAVLVFVFTAASNTLNDYFDMEGDRVNHPQRPLPSGRMEPGNAVFFASVLFAISVLMAALLSFLSPLGFWVMFMVLLALIIEVMYEWRLKRHYLGSNLAISILTGMAFVFGGVVVGNVEITLFMGLLAFLSIYGREILKDIEDLQGDTDRDTLPRVFGVGVASRLASVSILAAVILSPLPYFLGLLSLYYLPIVLVADCVFIFSALFQNPAMASKTVKYAMVISLFAFFAGRFA